MDQYVSNRMYVAVLQYIQQDQITGFVKLLSGVRQSSVTFLNLLREAIRMDRLQMVHEILQYCVQNKISIGLDRPDSRNSPYYMAKMYKNQRIWEYLDRTWNVEVRVKHLLETMKKIQSNHRLYQYILYTLESQKDLRMLEEVTRSIESDHLIDYFSNFA